MVKLPKLHIISHQPLFYYEIKVGLQVNVKHRLYQLTHLSIILSVQLELVNGNLTLRIIKIRQISFINCKLRTVQLLVSYHMSGHPNLMVISCPLFVWSVKYELGRWPVLAYRMFKKKTIFIQLRQQYNLIKAFSNRAECQKTNSSITLVQVSALKCRQVGSIIVLCCKIFVQGEVFMLTHKVTFSIRGQCCINHTRIQTKRDCNKQKSILSGRNKNGTQYMQQYINM